ncbi:MAG: threonylcarbamoyl-AMP synthase [Alphaproteobacteria bacterium]|nr:threonylcarbamoyl-AMP synthase [Alphaproteobacteria bacterium]
MTERLAAAQLDRAASLLHDGALVAFPTETVYGLGGDAVSDRAVAAIFAAKERPTFNPLIVHVADLAAAEKLAVFDERACAIAGRFWPGPLTLVLKRSTACPISRLASAGLETVALRAPAHPLAQALLRATGRPLAAPSANRSGHVSPTTADHVLDELGGRIAAVLDGGPCRVGIESTVIDLSEAQPALLRPGGVTREQLEAVLGHLGDTGHAGAPRSPGMLERHYATARPLRLAATTVAPDEALLAFGDPLLGAAVTFNLSPTRDLTEAAANLFAALRALDQARFKAIAVMPIPETGLGAAINDRLRRAARGRAN